MHMGCINGQLCFDQHNSMHVCATFLFGALLCTIYLPATSRWRSSSEQHNIQHNSSTAASTALMRCL